MVGNAVGTRSGCTRLRGRKVVAKLSVNSGREAVIRIRIQKAVEGMPTFGESGQEVSPSLLSLSLSLLSESLLLLSLDEEETEADVRWRPALQHGQLIRSASTNYPKSNCKISAVSIYNTSE